jgi:hypothetical protein
MLETLIGLLGLIVVLALGYSIVKRAGAGR